MTNTNSTDNAAPAGGEYEPAEYHPDCPACLRGRKHSQAEHEAALRRVYAASR